MKIKQDNDRYCYLFCGVDESKVLHPESDRPEAFNERHDRWEFIDFPVALPTGYYPIVRYRNPKNWTDKITADHIGMEVGSPYSGILEAFSVHGKTGILLHIKVDTYEELLKPTKGVWVYTGTGKSKAGDKWWFGSFLKWCFSRGAR
jgi:hypothetical protein